MYIDKILLVDDDADDQLFFRDALLEVNPKISCVIANNGLEALALLSSPPYPNLIFLDLNMPVMNGFDCLYQLRKKEELTNMPVVIFTTTSDHRAIQRTYELGANAFFKKPNEFSTILTKLRIILETDFEVREMSPVFSFSEFSF